MSPLLVLKAFLNGNTTDTTNAPSAEERINLVRSIMPFVDLVADTRPTQAQWVAQWSSARYESQYTTSFADAVREAGMGAGTQHAYLTARLHPAHGLGLNALVRACKTRRPAA